METLSWPIYRHVISPCVKGAWFVGPKSGPVLKEEYQPFVDNKHLQAQDLYVRHALLSLSHADSCALRDTINFNIIRLGAIIIYIKLNFLACVKRSEQYCNNGIFIFKEGQCRTVHGWKKKVRFIASKEWNIYWMNRVSRLLLAAQSGYR